MPKQTERVIHKGRRWATAEQAAEYIHVHPLTIRRLIADGKLKGNKGAGWRILRVDLDELDALVSGDK